MSTCRRVAPSVRSVASSRVRCAIVIESVFAITKLPTKSATPANASRKSLKIDRKPFVSFVACFASAWPVRTWAVGGRIGAISLTSSAGVVPDFAATSMPSSFPCLWKTCCAVGKSKIDHRRAAERRDAADLGDAGDLVAHDGAAGDDADRVADGVVLLLAVFASIATWCGPTGHVPLTSVSGLKRWSPCGWTLNASPGAPCPEITLPSRPTRCARSLMPPSAAATPGSVRTFVRSDSGNDGSAIWLFVVPADGALRADHGVRVLVDRA